MSYASSSAPDEPVPPGGVEGQPRRGEVGGGISRGEVAEVDDRRQGAVGTTRFAGCRSPWSHSGGPGQAGVALSSSHSAATRSAWGRARRAAGSATASCRVGSGTPRTGLCGAAGRRGPVQRGDDRGQRLGQRAPLPRRHLGRRRPGHPPAHAPRPRVAERRGAAAHGHRDGDRQAGAELGEPALLVHDEVGRRRAARQAHREVVAEPVDDVVPAAGDQAQRQRGQVRVLGGEEPADQPGVDGDLGGGLVGHWVLPLCVCGRAGGRAGDNRRLSAAAVKTARARIRPQSGPPRPALPSAHDLQRRRARGHGPGAPRPRHGRGRGRRRHRPRRAAHLPVHGQRHLGPPPGRGADDGARPGLRPLPDAARTPTGTPTAGWSTPPMPSTSTGGPRCPSRAGCSTASRPSRSSSSRWRRAAAPRPPPSAPSTARRTRACTSTWASSTSSRASSGRRTRRWRRSTSSPTSGATTSRTSWAPWRPSTSGPPARSPTACGWSCRRTATPGCGWATPPPSSTRSRGRPFLKPPTQEQIGDALDAAAAVGDDRIQAGAGPGGQPRGVDARLVRAARPVVHHRLRAGHPRRLRHLRGAAAVTAPLQPGTVESISTAMSEQQAMPVGPSAAMSARSSVGAVGRLRCSPGPTGGRLAENRPPTCRESSAAVGRHRCRTTTARSHPL